ncbi:MAG: hypothetical protein JNM89_15995 [Hyphomicrobiaceae bacterium]|nr:hypothetical protein [Hyphomicrobiaceae bacterium]
MAKSKFGESLEGLSGDQFARVQAEIIAEATRRGTSATDWDRVAHMSEHEFSNFVQRAYQSNEVGRATRELERAAKAHGKVLADPTPAATEKKTEDDHGDSE